MLIHLFFCLVLSFLMLGGGAFLGARFLMSRNKNSGFECGFDWKDSARLPFSVRFFLLAVVFLIFDIEIALLFPAVMGVIKGESVFTCVAVLLFVLILLFGLWHEWSSGSLTWVA